MLVKRCQEFIDINDSATPVIELIESGTTDVSHLIAKAKGRTGRPDPTDAQESALGRQIYQPTLTDEDVENLQHRTN